MIIICPCVRLSAPVIELYRSPCINGMAITVSTSRNGVLSSQTEIQNHRRQAYEQTFHTHTDGQTCAYNSTANTSPAKITCDSITAVAATRANGSSTCTTCNCFCVHASMSCAEIDYRSNQHKRCTTAIKTAERFIQPRPVS